MFTRVVLAIIGGSLLGCATEGSPDSVADGIKTEPRDPRAICVSIIVDTMLTAVDTFSLPGRSAEGALVEVSRTSAGGERFTVTFFGETGRLQQSFAYRGDTLVCAEERGEQYDRPLSGVVVETTPASVVFDAGTPTWFWTLTRADSLAGKADSLAATAVRLAADADTLRNWVAGQRRASDGR